MPLRSAALALLLLALGALPAAAQSEPIRVVVLGSSNAAGTGPANSDSTWVNRLRAYLEEVRPGSEVFNFARGGYLTYHLMPTGYEPPPGRQQPDPVRNITYALTGDPDVVVVSLTSNDSARGYEAEEQLERYEAILDEAGDVPVFITTTTPRGFYPASGPVSVSEGKRIQAAMRDSTLDRYGDRAIDFWTTLAAPDSTPAAACSAGDDVHFNNAGHRIFFERVRASSLLAAATPAERRPLAAEFRLRVLPNPQPTHVEVRASGAVRVEVFTARGRRVAVLWDGPLAGERRLPLGRLAPGTYVVRVTAGGEREAVTLTLAR